ncbi:DUF503 domain-containing protein [Pseudokineococcus sp. 1T1Z-3]|uniref:DUF503 domain-containing protein n=1 Tax=Pseudokineococcus sp. 1T1Z-3 TaxID=3132745 RepID=UPI0030A00FF6
MFVGVGVYDLLLPPETSSLKAKRSVVRPVVAALRRLEVSAAETGHLEARGRAEVSVAVVGDSAARCREVLGRAERLVADRPEVTLLSAREVLRSEDDW